LKEAALKDSDSDVRIAAVEKIQSCMATFYIFIAKGEGISASLNLADGGIGFGIKNKNAWYDNLISAYPC
jgi:hypothetical protein